MSDNRNQSLEELSDERQDIGNKRRSGLFRAYQPLDQHRLPSNLFTPVSDVKEYLDLDRGYIIDPHLGTNLSVTVNNLNDFIDIYG